MQEIRRGRGGRLAAPPNTAEVPVRVFFALWPDAQTRTALSQLAQIMQDECGGRMMFARNIHLTLVFIGNVAASRVEELRALADGIVTPRFELIIDAVEYWRHNHVVWAGPTKCPDALLLLVESLQDALRGSDFPVEERPYAPHITLLRDARRPPMMQTMPDIRWQLTEFALVQSLHRNQALAYEPIHLWPLGNAA